MLRTGRYFLMLAAAGLSLAACRPCPWDRKSRMTEEVSPSLPSCRLQAV